MIKYVGDVDTLHWAENTEDATAINGFNSNGIYVKVYLHIKNKVNQS